MYTNKKLLSANSPGPISTMLRLNPNWDLHKHTLNPSKYTLQHDDKCNFSGAKLLSKRQNGTSWSPGSTTWTLYITKRRKKEYILTISHSDCEANQYIQLVNHQRENQVSKYGTGSWLLLHLVRSLYYRVAIVRMECISSASLFIIELCE